MSQNDFTIANQGFPAFRADLNSALQALASNSSGTSAPSTTFANMWWYDSSNNIMYIRNEDNDAWIKFAELDQTNDKFVLSGTLQLDDGTVSAPALTFNSDTNMGIYRGGTDILKFVTAGTDAITIEANQDVNFAGDIKSGSSTGSLTIYGGATNQGGKIVLDGGNNDGDIVFHAEQFQASPKQRMLIANNGDISFYEDTGTTPKLFWDASAESLGIGTSTTGSETLVVEKSSGTPTIRINAPAGSEAQLKLQADNTTTDTQLIHAKTDASLAFSRWTGATYEERLRITSGGDVLVGTNSNTLNSLHFVHSSGGQHAMGSRVGTNGNFALGVLNSSGTVVGGVVANASSTAYNTSSDHRLKENVTADWEATTRLKQLNPVRFNFIADADTTVDGFLAHEVQSVVSEAITGTHNEVDADGNPVYQGIDQAKLVPLLVKTIQELEARITALENGE